MFLRLLNKQQWSLVLSLLLPIIALLGILDAGFIGYQQFTGALPPCSVQFQCSAVLQSSWSHIGPFPLSLLGFLYYLLIFCLSILQYFGKKHLLFSKKVVIFLPDLLLLFAGFGLLFSMYLVFLMGVVIQAWCLYCLLSALTCVLLFVLLSLNRKWQRQENLWEPSLQSQVFRALYHWIGKPIFFCFDAERVHNLLTWTGKTLGSFSWGRALTSWLFSYSDKKLVRPLASITFPNPVGLSAGFDYNADLVEILPSVGFGFATLGTITLQPYEGNPPPRLGRFPRSQALLVNKGFKNLGAKKVIARLEDQTFRIPVGISIGSTNKPFLSLSQQVQDIVSCFALFEASRVQHAYYELNISCPNTKGGQPFTIPARLRPLLQALEKLDVTRPVFIKMSIDLPWSETKALLETAQRFSCIHGVVFGNLTKDKENPDVHERDRLHWKVSQGNLSGKPTWRRSNAHIAATRKAFGKRFIIIGTGGIFSPQDAEQKLHLGADAVQLITGMIYEGPQLIGEINRRLAQRKL